MAVEKEQALNEFDQVVEGNSLGKDAWKRLRKNKMAVLGMVIVIIYALLSSFASFLPLHPYDEIILDHQQLPPSFTKTAGDLMMKSKLQDVYFKAWKNGELKVSDEQSQQVKDWIANNQINAVWNFVYNEGETQRAAGTYSFNTNDKKALDRLQKKIDTELLVTIRKIYFTDTNGKRVNMQKMGYEELLPIYARMTNTDIQTLRDQASHEVKNKILNDIKGKDNTLSEEEALANMEIELKTMGEKGFNAIAKENLYGKVLTQVKQEAEKQLDSQVSEGSLTLPLKRIIQISDTITAQIEASKKHSRKYFLGTDYSGRDILSRIIYGGQVSIAIGVVGTLTSVIIGILVGALAGYLGGKVDYILMRIVDVMYGLPYMLLVIICMAIFGRNILNLFIALALVSWLTIARMVRGQIMSLKNSEFVEAARSMGASTWRIIFRHMVPNSLSIIIVYSTLRVPAFIMQESFLSFLGLGVQAPYASWGSLVGDAVDGMTLYPWRLIFPALAMTIFLFAMNFFGDGLRDAFDPQSKNQL